MTDRLTGTYLMFAGPAGTGKTIAAEALAHELGLPVQLLEISALFSRWVGDFEEHVDKVFAAAQASGALLVVERGGRDPRSAHAGAARTGPLRERWDRAHPQPAGAVHRVTSSSPRTCSGPTTSIPRSTGGSPRWCASTNQTPTSARRCGGRSGRRALATATEVVLRFDLGPEGRDAYFRRLAHEHPLSGGSISNIARSATFLAAARDDDVPTITEPDVRQALAQELAKIGDFRSLTLARSRS